MNVSVFNSLVSDDRELSDNKLHISVAKIISNLLNRNILVEPLPLYNESQAL